MTSISFTSGELLDIISALEVQEDIAYTKKDNPKLASYYLGLEIQFKNIYDKLQEFPSEDRIANLVLAAN